MTARPRYVQLADALESRIRAGEWAPGAVFPSARSLYATHGQTTVTAALRLLRERGLIHAVSGSGTTVADPLPAAGERVDLAEEVADLRRRVEDLETWRRESGLQR